MTEPSTGTEVSPPETPVSASAAPRARAPWTLLLLVVATALAGWSAWTAWQLQESRRESERQQAEWRSMTEALEARVSTLNRNLEATRERQHAIDTRINDNAASARVVREEVLGIGERAGLLEEAVARLAESRERGDVGLRLNEVEFLLQLGEERLALFADPGAASSAFELARDALLGLDDPALAGAQQTLLQELDNLHKLGADPAPALRAQLGAVRRQLAMLPSSAHTAAATDSAAQSRLWQLLGKLVTVRRIDDQQRMLTPIERATRLATLNLHLDLAQAALERRETESWQSSLDNALLDFVGLFDAKADTVVRVRTQLEAARNAGIGAPQVELGATLRELRALRASRRTRLAEPTPARAAESSPDVEAETP